MKTIITLFFAILVLWSCNQNTKQEIKNIPQQDTVVKNEKSSIMPSLINQNKTMGIEKLSELIPIDTVNSKSKDVYEKFGLEFSGNCYNCDLAVLSITEKTIRLTNVCDEKLNQILEIIQITNTDNGIEIKTKQHNFIFTEIDKVPIYELKIIGDNIEIENLRFSKYYTLKNLLKKFKQHDCGDFQG